MAYDYMGADSLTCYNDAAAMLRVAAAELVPARALVFRTTNCDWRSPAGARFAHVASEIAILVTIAIERCLDTADEVISTQREITALLGVQ
ncbi:MAG: hypothetical protein LBD97_01835 [Bifidobacteriaceae bacterium]|jgi:hypothetical protein|nr:hypothetical protein [Bifidobacteriaceae bacterium]